MFSAKTPDAHFRSVLGAPANIGVGERRAFGGEETQGVDGSAVVDVAEETDELLRDELEALRRLGSGGQTRKEARRAGRRPLGPCRLSAANAGVAARPRTGANMCLDGWERGC